MYSILKLLIYITILIVSLSEAYSKLPVDSIKQEQKYYELSAGVSFLNFFDDNLSPLIYSGHVYGMEFSFECKRQHVAFLFNHGRIGPSLWKNITNTNYTEINMLYGLKLNIHPININNNKCFIFLNTGFKGLVLSHKTFTNNPGTYLITAELIPSIIIDKELVKGKTRLNYHFGFSAYSYVSRPHYGIMGPEKFYRQKKYNINYNGANKYLVAGGEFTSPFEYTSIQSSITLQRNTNKGFNWSLGYKWVYTHLRGTEDLIGGIHSLFIGRQL